MSGVVWFIPSPCNCNLLDLLGGPFEGARILLGRVPALPVPVAEKEPAPVVVVEKSELPGASPNAAELAEELKRALAAKSKQQKQPSENVSKPEAKAKGKAKGDDVKKDSHFGSSILKPPPFLGTSKRPPIYWGSCTIYFCADKWRVKVAKGDKKDYPRAFTSNPKSMWEAVIATCREKGTFDS